MPMIRLYHPRVNLILMTFRTKKDVMLFVILMIVFIGSVSIGYGIGYSKAMQKVIPCEVLK